VVPEVGEHSPTTPWPALVFAGGVAGVAGWLVTFPFDVIKTRMQASGLLHDSSNRKYRSMLSTIVASYREGGTRVFFRGLAPTLLRYVIQSP
jgi:solute carrier family 25 (mitochondrial carnitine/acylcarnitine transporter), member 20/29